MKSSLTLKNIYRLLTVQDYPVFSQNIFLPSDLKGMTLYRFYDQVLIDDLQSGSTGTLIFRQSGPRNRYLSSMCNGSCSPGLYKRYTAEIMELLSPQLLLKQTESYIAFFHGRRTDASVLHDKLVRYLSLIRRENPSFSSHIDAWLQECLRRFASGEDPDQEGNMFFLSLHLSVLTLLSVCGTENTRPDLTAVFSQPDFAPAGIRTLYRTKISPDSDFEMITDHTSYNERFGLSDFHFFGREREIFELRESIRYEKADYLICGAAGTGKSELLYQLINACRNENLPCAAALIHYENNLTDSLIRSFPFIHGTDRAATVFLLHQYLQEKAQSSLILFIDNIVRNKEDREEFAYLRSVGCRIYATSRTPNLSGFTVYQLEPLNIESRLLVFRDLYKYPLSKDQIARLKKLFEEKEVIQTLPVRMIASAANCRRWTPDRLLSIFEGGQDISLLQTASGGSNMRTVYRNLFRSESPSASVQHMMALAALLPQKPVERKTFLSWLTCASDDHESQAAVDQLILQSWIREDARGISVHPLIRAAFESRSLNWLNESSQMASLCAWWKQSGGYPVKDHALFLQQPMGSLLELSDFLYEIAMHMKFPLPSDFFDVMVEAMLLRLISYRSPHNDPLFEKMAEQQPLTKEQTLSLLSILLFVRICPDSLKPSAEQLCTELLEKKEERSDEEDIFLCLYGKYLSYINDERCPVIMESLYEQSDSTAIKALACIIRAAIAEFTMDAEGMKNWLDKGKECIEEGGLEQSHLQLQWLECTCNYLQGTVQYEELLVCSKKLQKIAENLSDKEAEWMALFFQGSVLIFDPDQAEQGVSMLETSRDIALSVAQDDFPVLFLSKYLAMGYEKTARFEESEKIYLECIALLRKYPQRVLDLQQYENNLGVLYQHWGKWEKSLPLLEGAVEKALQFESEISLAEPRNNISKYYRHTGDFEKEKELLRQVVPVFRSAYGDEHPKTIDAMKRLEECESKTESS